MLRERVLSSLYQLILFLFAIWGAFLILTVQRISIFPLGVMIYNGREIYVLIGLVLLILLYLVAPRLANMFQGKKIFSDEVKPSLASYLLVLLIFSSGLWLRSIALFFFLPIFYLSTLGMAISKIEYQNRLKQHYSVMRFCLIIFLPFTIPFIIALGLSRGPEYFCLAHDLLALTLIFLYFIVSSLEIKRKRDPWPFL